MTVKLVVLYTHPDDADAFDQHYLDVHMPLVNKLPGLQRFESGRIVTALSSSGKGESSVWSVRACRVSSGSRISTRSRFF